MESADLTPNLQALQRLADRLPFRVMVVDTGFRVMYDNALGGSQSDARRDDPWVKCYETVAFRSEPCRACPAIEAIRSGEVTTPLGTPPGAHCGFLQEAIPLGSLGGKTGAALLTFGEPVTAAPGSSAPVESPLSGEADNRLGRLIGRSQPMEKLFD